MIVLLQHPIIKVRRRYRVDGPYVHRVPRGAPNGYAAQQQTEIKQ